MSVRKAGFALPHGFCVQSIMAEKAWPQEPQRQAILCLRSQDRDRSKLVSCWLPFLLFIQFETQLTKGAPCPLWVVLPTSCKSLWKTFPDMGVGDLKSS